MTSQLRFCRPVICRKHDIVSWFAGFPTGGFSQSLGLEAAAQHKFVSNATDIKQFLEAVLQNTGQLMNFSRKSTS